MALQYRTGEITDEAEAISAPLFARPFPGVQVDYVLTQRFMQPLANWSPLALNTVHPDYTDFLLVEESPLEDALAGLVTWGRTYAKTPDSYNEPAGNYNYRFIGYGLTASAAGRDPFTRSVAAKLQRDFFLVDGVTYPDWTDIPVIEAQRYHLLSSDDLEVLYLVDAPPYLEESVPNRTDYEAMVVAGDYIAVEDSRLTRWMGNIYVRETLYVKAQ